MKKINEEDSLLLQSLAITSLLADLSNANFLEDDYFHNLRPENDNITKILKASGIGNPATMQMMLYALLCIPKELFSRENEDEHSKLIPKEVCYR